MTKTPEPENPDAAFSAIVSGLEADWTTELLKDSPSLKESNPSRNASFPTKNSWRTSETPWEEIMLGVDKAPDDERYVPPEPPPLPKPSKQIIIALVIFLLGLFLIIAPGLINLGKDVGMILGMLCLAIGLGLLLLRAKKNSSAQDDYDDGAQV